MNKHPFNRNLQGLQCSVLGILLPNGNTAEIAMKHGAGVVLLQTLRLHKDAIEVQRASLQVLSKLAINST